MVPAASDLVQEAKEKKRSAKARDGTESEAAAVPLQKAKKEKRKKSEGEEKTKKKRKREPAEAAADDVSEPPNKAKKAKKAEAAVALPPASDASDDTAVLSADDEPLAVAEPTTEPPNPLAVDNFRLSPGVKTALQTKGIQALFDIQALTLSHVLDGKDLLGRARTGCGKTLAFVLPIIEKLAQAGNSNQRGRPPRVIVLAPTRELAKQVFKDFEWMGAVFKLSCTCIYGGSPYGPQEGALRRGMDVVVGTPGRVKDMMEKGVLKLDKLQFRVLDECDEMLNMGFVDDVEKILNAGGSEHIQTLLFSATLPAWVKDIQKRFLKPDFKLVDLVGNEKQKASTSVRHLVLPCHWSQRSSVAADCVRIYGAMGRTIVFTDTKRDANEMATALESFSARPLHGDIPQSQRETTLAGFRANKFRVLVATDVAARGLDISGVELVLQMEPPKDPENYIHRSGRTGRAGCTGISLTMVDKKKEGLIPFIEKRAGFKFERVGAPQPADMAKIAGERAVAALEEVDGGVVPWFRAAASDLLSKYSDPEEALARALAKITGHTALQARSLLTSHEDYTTLMFHNGADIQKPGAVWAFLKRSVADGIVEEVQRLTLTEDGCNAVFDVPSARVQDFLSKYPAPKTAADETNLARGIAQPRPYLSLPSKLPALKKKEGEHQGSSSYSGGRFASGRGGGFNSGRPSFAMGRTSQGFGGNRGRPNSGGARGGGRGGGRGGNRGGRNRS